VLDYAAALVRVVVSHDALGVEGVAVGFDDGDFTIIWSLG
jgi:hypothetical protein